jgi:hypothetical protein
MEATSNRGIETASEVEEIFAPGNGPPDNPDSPSELTPEARILFRTPAEVAADAYTETEHMLTNTGWATRNTSDAVARYPGVDSVITSSLEQRFDDSRLLDTLFYCTPDFNHHCHPHVPAKKLTLSEGLVVFAFARVTRYNRQRMTEAVAVHKQK